MGRDGGFSILDELERPRVERRRTRRKVLKWTVGVGVLGVVGGSTIAAFSGSGGSKRGSGSGKPSRVDAGPSTVPTAGVLAGPAQAPLWTKTLPAGDYQVAAANGTLFVAGRQISALDGATGAQRWQSAVDMGFVYDSAPLVAGDTLYALTGQGDLVALGLADGAEKWRTGVPDSRWMPSGIVGVIGSVILCFGDVTGGTATTSTYSLGVWAVDTVTKSIAWHASVLAKTSGNPVVAVPDAGVVVVKDVDAEVLTGYDAAHGAVVWRLTDPRRRGSGSAGTLSPDTLTAAGKTVFWAGEQLYAVDATNGNMLWQQPAMAEPDASIGALWTAAGSDAVFVAGMTGTKPVGLFAYKASDGTQLWAEDGDRWFGTQTEMARVGNVLFVTQRDTGSVFAVDAATGRTRWTFHDGNATTDLSWPLADDGTQVFTVYGTTLRAFQP
jgi:outer membrane protein assembly factor BamB